jgi:methylglutaconyl-CoA hydratase
VIAAVGERAARRYMLSGEEFDCAEAYRIGLLHRICPEAELTGTVGHMLAQLYLGGPGAIVAIKRLIPDIAGSDVDETVVEKTAQALADLRATPEGREGLAAFLEKRKPAWTEPPAPGKKTSSGKSARRR